MRNRSQSHLPSSPILDAESPLHEIDGPPVGLLQLQVVAHHGHQLVDDSDVERRGNLTADVVATKLLESAARQEATDERLNNNDLRKTKPSDEHEVANA